MNNSFEYIDIILLAMIAGFIFLRLRGILGKRTGFEGKPSSQFEKVINNVQINNSLDKAISVGEGTNVEMYNLLISNSRAGIVVKEGSIAIIEGYTPKNNELSDVAAFRKKSYLNDPIVFIINKKNIVLNIKSDFKSKVV